MPAAARLPADWVLAFVPPQTKRTLVLPPWTDYSAKDEMGVYPYFWWFSSVFSVEKMAEAGYKQGKVIDLSTFITHFKDKWASFGFRGFCTHPMNRPDGWLESCMESEVPKAPFWRNLGITFTEREVLNAPSHRVIKRVKHPVVALDCAPAKYPALEKHDGYAKFLFWADPIIKEAKAFIAEHLPRPYVAMHLRQAFLPSCERGIRCVHFWRPFWLRFPYVTPVLFKNY
jgi:hypothetical protein